MKKLRVLMVAESFVPFGKKSIDKETLSRGEGGAGLATQEKNYLAWQRMKKVSRRQKASLAGQSIAKKLTA